jgi:subtilisin-like proprotein convertase family protein
VAGTSGSITKVVVKLNNMNHTFPGDYDILLVGPGGQSAIIMSDAGGGGDIIGVTLTLDDAAAANMTGAQLVTGTFKPTNLVGVAPEPDTWPAPAPAPPAGGASALSAFNGTSANGAWNLWVFDDAAGDFGNINSGWDLIITTAAACGTPTPSPSVSPGTPTPSPTVTPGTPTPSPTVSPGGCSFINGGLNPQPLTESGVAAPAGFFWSEVQHDAGNMTVSNTNAGYADTQGTNRLADNFTLTQACTINNFVFYGYLTGSPATPSPFTAYTVQIWNGRPGDPGAVVVFGDTTTNRLASSTDSTFFRIFNTVVPPPGTVQGTTRKIWRNTVTVGMLLPAGTYWVDWASTVTGAVNHFAPAKTIPGARSAAGDNARQFAAGAWTDVVDAGFPATPPSVPQDFPFEVNGLPLGGTPSPTVSPGTPTPSPTATASATPCGSSATFSNPAAITIPDSGPGAPYPSNIAVAGLAGTVTKVTVALNGLTHTFPADLDILLVGPGGQNIIIMSDVGGGDDVTNINLVLDDAAANPMPAALLTSGTYKPTNTGTGDTFPAPAPVPSANTTFASTFNGTSPNGTWALYLVDDAAADLGTLSGGWAITITTSQGCATPTPSPTPPASPTPTCAPLMEAFEDITTLPAAGWVQTNHSTTVGTTSWFQGNTAVFTAQAGTPASYIGANFNNTTGTNTISNWLLTPARTLQNGATMTFWTRTTTANPFPDRLQVRMSTAGASSNVGTTATDVGDFTTLLLDINPTYTVGGYPEVWTLQTVTITGVPTATLGRLAFRYFVENGGPTGANSNYIGIDTFQYNAPCPGGTPTPSPTSTPSASPTIPPSTPTPTPTASATASPSASPTATVPGSPTPTPGVSPPSQAVNLSTRMRVQTGDRVGIGGFIITGGGPKQVLLRAIGPSLTRFDIVDVLADPVLELHGPTGFVTITNNNWRDTQQAAIQATGLAPTNDLESAILATLPAGAYTAIVKGNGGTSGVALVEVYDLGQSAGKLANLSTRAFVATADNIVIAGFVLANGGSDNVILRGIGPSLTAAGVATVLADPTLELRDHNGTLLLANNDWQDNPAQAALITAAGLAPSNNLESAIAATLPPGLYTVLLAGLNNTTGNGLVEVYDRGAAGGVPAPTPTPTPPSGTPTPTATPTPGAPTPTPTTTPIGATPTPTPPPATPTPTPAGNCTENFDTVTAPALPAGWVATNVSGNPPLWVTTTVTPDSPPNDAFVDDQNGISDKQLDSRNIVMGSGGHTLSFRNWFQTEHDPPPAEVFWDGYVLEVSRNGAPFSDIIAEGGVFVSGPYTGEIDGTAANPLAGRMAWSGTSGGGASPVYINTVITVPASFDGQTIKLRFRMGSDEAVAQPGARVDGLIITNASCP